MMKLFPLARTNKFLFYERMEGDRRPFVLCRTSPPHRGLVVIGYKTRNEAQIIANDLKNSKVTEFWPFNIYKMKENHENRQN